MTTQVAFLFPGQGSQAVGMGADILATSVAARCVFAAFDDALGISLSTLCSHGDMLCETSNAQPAIVAVSLALLAALQETLSPYTSSWSFPLTPNYIAGHSVGENTALVASGALSLHNVAGLVQERGRVMHHEGTICPGGMAAVLGLDAETLQEVCQEATQKILAELSPEAATHPGQGRVVVANYNAPGQVVISGEQRALTLATELARERGARRVIALSVSGAFHSPVMLPAATKLMAAIDAADIHDATIPVIGNVTATPLTTAQALRAELSQQIAAPVQWSHTIEYLKNAGVTVFIEIGPGQVLTGLVKRIVKDVTTLNISSGAEITKVAALARELGIVHNV